MMSRVRDAVRTAKRIVKAALGRDLFVRPELEVPCQVLGSAYGAHCVATQGLGPGGVAYSFGVGDDVSFDLALIERFGLEVHAFDPTPASVAWVARQVFPERLRFHPVGLAANDGLARFRPPRDPNHVSYAMGAPRDAGAAGTVELPVRTLASLMAEHGHARLDVLKLDVEGGAEYDAIDALCTGAAEVDQVLVEFHHGRPGFGAAHTRAALGALRDAGYRLFHVSDSGHELTYIHARALAPHPNHGPACANATLPRSGA
jgi:FkbM family methyltransferase